MATDTALRISLDRFELLFHVALTFGLPDDPVAAVGGAVGFVTQPESTRLGRK